MFSNTSPLGLQRVSESEIKVQRACRELEVEKVVFWTVDLPLIILVVCINLLHLIVLKFHRFVVLRSIL